MRRRASFVALALAAACTDDAPPEEEPCPPAPRAGNPLFVDATAALGIDFVHHLATDFCALEDNVGGPGVCLFDYDGDDDVDIYLSDHAPYPNRLYRNDGSSFTDVSAEAGVDSVADGMGCLAFDYDGDADLDLYLTNAGPDELLQNDGGRFSDVTEAAGIDEDGFSISATAGDIDADGDLDLFVGGMVDLATCPDECLFPPIRCAANQRDLLYENTGGAFREVGLDRGLDDDAPTLATLMFDFELDGDIDIYVGNDMGLAFADVLYLNDGTGQFHDAAAEYTVQAPGSCTMGVDTGDFDMDGHADMVITDFEDRPIRLFRCYDPARPCSNEVAPDGLAAVKWGVGFVDFDHDLDLDLFTANGDVRAYEPERNFLYFNQGLGNYAELLPSGGEALALMQVSRGAAFGDLDGDGDVDIVVANAGAPAQVLLNQAAAGHALQVALDTTATGARVTATSATGTLTEQAVVGGSFASSNDPRLHFGLGQACRADLAVRYLDGTEALIQGARAGEVVRISREE